MTSINERIETFFQQLSASGELSLYREPLAPSSPEDIVALQEGLGLTLASDVKEWLATGCDVYQGSVDEPSFAGIGFAFLDAARALEHTLMLRESGEGDGEHAELVRSGVALTYEEPEILWTPTGVYSFSFRNPVLKVASNLTEFLECWLASGCFGSHDFESAWTKTRSFVPSGMSAPDANPWVIAYRSMHDEG